MGPGPKAELSGPFGNPDGSRAQLDAMLHDFVNFRPASGFGALSTRADDSTARVIVGKLGAGKTVYLRRLHDHQSRQASVYADVPQQSPPPTEVVVKACQWFSGQVLVEKWMQIWGRAILRTVVSHLLLRPELRDQVSDFDRTELETGYRRVIGEFRRPRGIYNQVREIVTMHHTAHQLSQFLDDPLWDDLEDFLGEILAGTRPLYFYLDAVDEEFSHAPMYWLKCQEGLFYQVMRMLRDHRYGGRLHVVIAIRDIVMSSVYRSEHAPRYHAEPHIRVLAWDRDSLLVLLQDKLQRLPAALRMRQPTSTEVTLRDWLGLDKVTNEWGLKERVDDYLVRHTRMIPRDVVSLGNELAEEVLRQKRADQSRVPEQALHDVVARCAKRFGDSQLAQCANQVSSDQMPAGAAQYGYSELYTSTQTYLREMVDRMRDLVRMIGSPRFSAADLDGLRQLAVPTLESGADIGSVLWLNGLLGYVDDDARDVYYGFGDVESFTLPEHARGYVVHPCLVRSVGLETATGAPR